MRHALLALLVLLIALPATASRTVDQVMTTYGPSARIRLAPYYAQLPIGFDADRMKLVAFKAERRMEVWLGSDAGQWHQLRNYPIVEASGSLRPKMRQGDLQVPEGVYRIEASNPNSNFHLSLKVDYPNELDRFYAAQENRQDLGGDIFIHGKDKSTGCLAMGDRYIEELFVLAHDIGLDNIEMVISPRDPRRGKLQRPVGLPDWVDLKYQKIEASLAQLPGALPAL